MEEKSSAKLMREIKEELVNEAPDYRFFKTKTGIIFQDNFVNLRNYLSFENIFPKFISVIPQLFDKLMNEKIEDFKDKYKARFQIMENNKIIIDEIMDIKQLLDDLFQQNEMIDVINKRNPERIERLNAYYFLALNALMDNYATSTYETLIKRFCQPHLFDLLIHRKPSGSPIDQLNTIKNKLGLINKKEFNLLFEGTSWLNDLSKLYKIRNILAHENPHIRLEKLTEHFPEISQSCKANVQNMFQKSQKQFNNPKTFNQIQEILEPSFHILEILTETGKICYGYLAIIDNLLDEYFKTY